MPTPVQIYMQAEKAIEALKLDPQVQTYRALQKQLRNMELGVSSVSADDAVHLYLNKLAFQEQVHAVKIKNNVVEAGLLSNKKLASIMRNHPDYTPTGELVHKGNAVFIRTKKVRT